MNFKNVLSCFDGISCGQLALIRAGHTYDNYYASEIKPEALQVTKYNWPSTIQLGDIRSIDFTKLRDIDLLIGGSPCQDLSQGHKERAGLKGNKSSLFWQYAKAYKILKPKWFLLENVEMPSEDYETISEEMGTYPININSELVSAQQRNRFYWTNIGPANYDLFGKRYCAIKQPQDKGIFLQSILESGYTDRLKARCLLASDSRPLANKDSMLHRYYNTGFTTIIFEDKNDKQSCRYLTRIELERCQTLPDGYTEILTRNKAAGCIGDSWTVDVIAHIFSYMKEQK